MPPGARQVPLSSRYLRAFVKRGVCADIITHRRSKNTICGRHPIAVLLHAIEISKVAFEIGFTHYASAGPLRTALALPRQLCLAHVMFPARLGLCVALVGLVRAAPI